MVGFAVARPTTGPRLVNRVDRMVGRIGVAVGAMHLRAVGMRRTRIAWALESALIADEPLATALERFLRALPLHRLQRWARPSVRVVLGARHAQLKRLTGLPPGLDGRQLARLVQEGAPRFFLRNGHPLVTTGVANAPDGATWSAALDADVVDAVRAACRGAGFRLTGIGPAATALPLALEGSAMVDGVGEELYWEDEGEQVLLRVAGGQIVSAARVDGAESERTATRAPARPRTFLAPLAEQGARFADAGGAALIPADAPLLHHPQHGAPVSSRVPRWRVATATLALVLSGCAALLARPLAASRAERAAAARLAELGPARAEAVRMQRDLAQVSAALAEVERFAGARRSPTLLLANLARALPQGSALVAVRMESHADTSGVVLTLLAPRAAPVLGAIEKLSGVVSPQIVGSVTREVVGGGGASGTVGSDIERTTLERMTVRFRLAASGPAAATTEAEP